MKSKQINISIFLCIVAILCITGTSSAQIMIYTVTDLQNMQNGLMADYVLANDIDASDTMTWNSGAGFDPIGDGSNWFEGTFDGAGHTISGLYISRPGENDCGLFAVTGDFAAISNLTLSDVNITGGDRTGGLIGSGKWTTAINNCHVQGTVTGNGSTGGLIGEASDCSFTACCTDILVSASESVGGLVGLFWGTGSITQSYSKGDVTGTVYRAGGIVGYAFSGSGSLTISNCYSLCDVSCSDAVGGLCGRIANITLNLENCYAAGAVSGTTNQGGMIGLFEGTVTTALTNNYWDVDESGQANSVGEGPNAIEGKTTTEMMQQATFVGWDFSTVWSICDGISYPYLQALPDNDNPDVTINQGSAQPDVAVSLPIIFDVVFSVPVTGFDNTDVDFSAGTSQPTAYTVTDNGDSMSYTVAVTAVNNAGLLVASIPADAAVSCMGIGNAASTSTDNSVAYVSLEIYNVYDLQAMQYYLDGDYVLMNDIDASETATWNSGAGFAPIGDPFQGTLDGAGHTISGLYINRPSLQPCGLFYRIYGGSVSNLNLINATIAGRGSVGCFSGLVQNTLVTNCHVNGSVSASDPGAGGLAGSVAIGSVVSNCSAACTVTGTSFLIGGLLGSMSDAAITGCYASGNVSGASSTGGLIGFVGGGNVINCYSNSAVSGSYNVGGLIGDILLTSDLTVTNCYSVGAVSGSGSDVGGLIGAIFEMAGTVTLTNTYWDTETSLQSGSTGAGPGASEGKTTAAMMQQATFVGWDFGSTWSICEGSTYPYLQSLPAPYPTPAPLDVTLDQAPLQNDPVNTMPLVFSAVFSVPVTGFEDTDLDFTGSTATVTGATVTDSGDGMTYTIEVTASDEGSVMVSIPADVAMACGNVSNTVSVSTDNSVTYDITPPDITIGLPSQASVSPGGSVDFVVDYTGEASSWLTETDITLDTTGDATATVTVSSMKDSSYIVTLDNITGTGTLGFTIAANTADDAAGNLALSASTPVLVTVEPGVPINAIPVAVSLLGMGILLLRKRQHRK